MRLDSTDKLQCMLLHMQALSNSIDGSAALLGGSVSPIAALVQLLQQQSDPQDLEAAVAAMQCLSNLTRSSQGVDAALQAQLPLCAVTVVTEVSPWTSVLCDGQQVCPVTAHYAWCDNRQC